MTQPQGQSRDQSKSALHRKVRDLLRELYPQFTVSEEGSMRVNIGGRATTVFVDLQVKEMNLCVECHGRQHFEFVPHFHGTRSGFVDAVARDQAKAQFIKSCGFSYLTIRFDEEKTLTRRRLLSKILKAIKE
jgi:very-short-patch-repair endonuclease